MQSSCWWKTLPLVVSRQKNKTPKKKKQKTRLTRSTQQQKQQEPQKRLKNNILKLLACA